MKVIIKQELNRPPSIIFPVGNYTIENILEELEKESSIYVVTELISYDYSFWDAYEFDKELGAKINIEKAKEIQKNKWRDARKKIFEKLDIDFMLALEKGDIEQQKIIAQKKQELRDITKTILPDDLEEMKLILPNILN